MHKIKYTIIFFRKNSNPLIKHYITKKQFKYLTIETCMETDANETPKESETIQETSGISSDTSESS